MEAVYREFAGEGVAFFYVYKRLAHPGLDGYVDPFTLKERLAHIQEAKRKLGTKIPWICDTMQDDMKHAFGGAPNSEFILDRQGRIVCMRSWSNPRALRDDLIRILGASRGRGARPVAPHDSKPRKSYPTRVVPQPRHVPDLRRLRVEPLVKPESKGAPYYAKLQAFGQDSVVQDGDGLLRLVFQLDPIHHIHWNNLAEPLKFELAFAAKTDHGGTWNNFVRPSQGEAPRVDVEADVDPREFLVHVCGVTAAQPLEMHVRYFVCSNEFGWCRAVSQSYQIYFEEDRDARRRMDGRASPLGTSRFRSRGILANPRRDM